ncbi:MAG: sulfite exporter TauE/SafE family protein [Candidatus Bathyarchaeia archaeon]
MITALIELLEVASVGVLAGVIGSVIGLGGGVLLTPILTLFLGVPIKYATGASAISTIATSCSAASVYVKNGLANARIGMVIELSTIIGAVIGALTAHYVYSSGLTWLMYIVFGFMSLISMILTVRRGRGEPTNVKPPDWTTRVFKLYGKYYDSSCKSIVEYYGVRWWLAECILFFSGFSAGMLGIGGGAFNVVGLDWAMNLPIKIATATSSFIIGATSATTSMIYWSLGYIHPILAAVSIIGVSIGARIGARILSRISGKRVRQIFIMVLGYLSINMILRGVDMSGYIPIPRIQQYAISMVVAICILFVILRSPRIGDAR